MADQFKNYVDGNWLGAHSGNTFDNRNPANTDDLIGLFPASGADDVDAAVAAAKKAFAAWRLVPAPKRGEILYRVGELLKKYKEESGAHRDSRDGQGVEGNPRRCSGRHRLRVSQCRRGAAAVWRDHAGGVAQQIRHVGAHADRRVRVDHAVEFPAGDSYLETISGADLRQYGDT